MILMNAYNIHFHDKIKKKFLISLTTRVFLSYWENFLGTQKQVQIRHGKGVIAVLVIKVLLYVTVKPVLKATCIK